MKYNTLTFFVSTARTVGTDVVAYTVAAAVLIYLTQQRKKFIDLFDYESEVVDVYEVLFYSHFN